MLKRSLPVIGTIALLGWIFGRVPVPEVMEALGQVPPATMIGLTLGLIVGLYLWEVVCLRWLFSRYGPPARFAAVGRARGLSYLVSAVNYELGQGMLAWLMARSQGTGVRDAIGRCVLLSYQDVMLLCGFGLMAAALMGIGRSERWVGFCGVVLAALGLAWLLARALPARWTAWLRRRPMAGLFFRWTWSDATILWGLGVMHFAVIGLYVWIAGRQCGIPLPAARILEVVPLVSLADGLPISMSGLGTREAVLVSLLGGLAPPRRVLAFSLIWSTGTLLGRAGIGLAWLPWRAGGWRDRPWSGPPGLVDDGSDSPAEAEGR